MTKYRIVYILGAGFSYYAGLPLQAQFTSSLLKSRGYKTGRSRDLTARLDSFVQAVFGSPPNAAPDRYPELEDIFTNIDLSANSGHYLGKNYTPGELRTTRRILISRIIRMLGNAFDDGKKSNRPDRRLLSDFLRGIDGARSQFISLNWDTVLEAMLTEIKSPFVPDYGRGISKRRLKNGLVTDLHGSARTPVLVVKMHGSINWLYCENCRRVYSFPEDSWARIAAQVLKSNEQESIYGQRIEERIFCPACAEVDLGIRLATFSYQKALNFPMFDFAWQEASEALNRADKWVFVGYSLPAADFQFKFLLKRSQLARMTSPKIHVVTGGDAARNTVESYRKFFGADCVTAHIEGLTPESIEQITNATPSQKNDRSNP